MIPNQNIPLFSSKDTSSQTAPPPPSFTKPTPRVKAVARPEEPGGTEDVCYGDILINVPTELFKLDSLNQVLNIISWEECLTKGEQDFLLQFLPEVSDKNEVLERLLDGHSNFFFGNPMERIWDLMKDSECHPRVVKYREGLRCLHHCQHFHNVKSYHNALVVSLRQMAADNTQEPLHKRLQKWKARTRNSTTRNALHFCSRN